MTSDKPFLYWITHLRRPILSPKKKKNLYIKQNGSLPNAYIHQMGLCMWNEHAFTIIRSFRRSVAFLCVVWFICEETRCRTSVATLYEPTFSVNLYAWIKSHIRSTLRVYASLTCLHQTSFNFLCLQRNMKYEEEKTKKKNQNRAISLLRWLRFFVLQSQLFVRSWDKKRNSLYFCIEDSICSFTNTLEIHLKQCQ